MELPSSEESGGDKAVESASGTTTTAKGGEASSSKKQSPMSELMGVNSAGAGGGGGGGGGTSAPPPLSPFEIDMILQLIFEFCSPKELKASRLVSKRWYKVSLPVWLNKGPRIVLYAARQLPPPPPMDHLRNAVISVFLEKFRNSRSESEEAEVADDENLMDFYEYRGIREYRKFRVFFSSFVDSDRGLLSGFWGGWGTWVRDLSFDNFSCDLLLFRDVLSCKFTPNLEELQTNVRLTWKQVKDASKQEEEHQEEITFQVNPNLKRLALAYSFITSDGNENQDNEAHRHVLPIDWTKIFACYPNLKHLTTRLSGDEFEDVDVIIKAINGIRQSNRKKLALKSLDICSSNFQHHTDKQLPQSVLELLRSTNLHLNFFGFHFCASTPTPLVYDLLELQKENLKELEILRCEPIKEFYFPVMSSLRLLKLFGQPFKNLKWLTSLPNLATLKLIRIPFRAQKHQAMIQQSISDEQLSPLVLPFMTKFDCNYYHEWTEQEVRKFHKWMPNLKNLRLDIGNSTFHWVCEYWPNLEHLHIYGDHIGDIGITGVEVVAKQRDEFGDVTEWGMVMHYPSNITVLQELKSFTMSSSDGFDDEDDPKRKMTKSSVYHGLLKLPNLREVSAVIHGNDHEENDLVLKTLLDSVPDAKLTFI